MDIVVRILFVTAPSGYGSSCTYQSQCSFANSQCLSNICYCASGYDYDGYNCQGGGGGQIAPSNGLNCDVDEVAIFNKCYPTRRRGQQCFYDEQCILDDGLECFPGNGQDGICRDKIQSDQYPIPVGPGPVIFPPPLPQPPMIYPPSPQYPQPRPFPQFQQPPQITIITICCLKANSWPCCNCAINQVYINGRCYTTSLPGGSCQYDQQCTDPKANNPLYCGNGICRWVFSGNR
uniref:EB domain-containing protein n=1 Tax=Panagrolaimus davidi TaxID=227884 RepID=A0A914QH42_9BILA